MAAVQGIAVHGFAHEWILHRNLLSAVFLLLTFPGEIALLISAMSSGGVASPFGYAMSIVINCLAGFLLAFLWTEDEGTPSRRLQ